MNRILEDVFMAFLEDELIENNDDVLTEDESETEETDWDEEEEDMNDDDFDTDKNWSDERDDY